MTDLRKAAEQALFRLLGDENHDIQLRAAVALLQAPVREWAGLTDDVLLELLAGVDEQAVRLPPGLRAFARAIEAKLKDKNQ